jgi:hypothetical protein
MKKILSIALAVSLYACGGSGEGGTVNDGFNGAADTNGALQDTPGAQINSATDTSRQENRVDIQQRNMPDTTSKQ